MGFFNPYGQSIRFLEETLSPLPPVIITDTMAFSLSEALGVPGSPSVSDTLTFNITETVGATT